MRRIWSGRIGDFRFWHVSDMAFLLRDVRSPGQSGNYMLALSFSAFDPVRTSGVFNVRCPCESKTQAFTPLRRLLALWCCQLRLASRNIETRVGIRRSTEFVFGIP